MTFVIFFFAVLTAVSALVVFDRLAPAVCFFQLGERLAAVLTAVFLGAGFMAGAMLALSY